MSVADESLHHTADDHDSREESDTMHTQTHQENQSSGQRMRWLVAEIGYRLVALGAWLDRFGTQQSKS